jgi:hypothetical protein
VLAESLLTDGAMPNGLSRLAEPEGTAPADTFGIEVDPAAGVGLVELRDDQGRQNMRPMANRPAAIPMATRADLKTVWLRFSSRIAADA